jgi:hypothetical protein
MAMAATSLEGIQTWARQRFPDDFKHLPSAASFVSQLNTVPGYNSDVYFKSLVIGTTCNEKGKTVQSIAWLEGSHVKIGYIGKDRNDKQQIRSMAMTEKKRVLLEFQIALPVPSQQARRGGDRPLQSHAALLPPCQRLGRRRHRRV